jgi:hypothetical protein
MGLLEGGSKTVGFTVVVDRLGADNRNADDEVATELDVIAGGDGGADF